MPPSCVKEIRAFVRGDLPGLQRLKEVLPSIFKHYGVTHKRHQAQILIQCKLMPSQSGKHVTFVFDPSEG